MKTKKGEKDKLRVSILESAISYFKENGSGASGISGIMKHAGLTTGALYSHFKSKDELFGETICHELEKLEIQLFQIFRKEKKHALKVMIELYFEKERLVEVGDGCVFTALGSDMHRSKAAYRARYEEYTQKVYQLFADSIQLQFPKESPESCYEKAMVLYSGMVGAMTMARTTKNLKVAHAILDAEKKHLIQSFVAKENQ